MSNNMRRASPDLRKITTEPKHVIITLASKQLSREERAPISMPTIEERVQALEQEHTELRKTIELQTIAIGALVNKATLEKLNEKYDKLFEALIAHDSFTNEQLAELRNQQTELDGKVIGLQTEMRQRFTELQTTQAELQTTQAELQTTQIEHTALLTEILARLPEKH